MENIRTWRICHKNYSAEALTGEGARIHGARFNSAGHSVIYTSGSLSLSLLEMMVRMNDRSYFSSCVFLHADVPLELVSEPDPNSLPAGWDCVPYGRSSQSYGDKWLSDQTSAVMKVPSVLIPFEYNYILNPRHRDFEKIECSEPAKLPFDNRL